MNDNVHVNAISVYGQFAVCSSEPFRGRRPSAEEEIVDSAVRFAISLLVSSCCGNSSVYGADWNTDVATRDSPLNLPTEGQKVASFSTPSTLLCSTHIHQVNRENEIHILLIGLERPAGGCDKVSSCSGVVSAAPGM